MKEHRFLEVRPGEINNYPNCIKSHDQVVWLRLFRCDVARGAMRSVNIDRVYISDLRSDAHEASRFAQYVTIEDGVMRKTLKNRI